MTTPERPEISQPSPDPGRPEPELPVPLLYRDAMMLVIDKPAGLPSHRGPQAKRRVIPVLTDHLDALRFGSNERPRLVHRLDKDTSGVLLLARNPLAATKLAESFRSRDTKKIYWAVTVGVPKPFQGKIDIPLAKEGSARGERVAEDEDDGKRALTVYSVLENLGKQAAFVALWPRTGRTHQLRVHMNAIGTPILGDGKYGGQGAFLPGAELPKKLHLHARRIIIPHPRGARPIDVTAPLPDHMRTTWSYLGFDPSLGGDPFAELD